LQVARLRAQGRIAEIGTEDLSLTRQEAASLLRDAGVALDDAEVAQLHQRTEGWAAGLYLAALYLREGGSVGRAAVSFGGDDRLVSEYMEAEFLARISRWQRVFLTETAVLEQISGTLCEEVLELPEAGAILAELARSNLLLVPLDRRGQWYRRGQKISEREADAAFSSYRAFPVERHGWLGPRTGPRLTAAIMGCQLQNVTVGRGLIRQSYGRRATWSTWITRRSSSIV